jgi:hypothetical protein
VLTEPLPSNDKDRDTETQICLYFFKIGRFGLKRTDGTNGRRWMKWKSGGEREQKNSERKRIGGADNNKAV